MVRIGWYNQCNIVVILFESRKTILNYAALLEAYTIEELLEFNDKTSEECIEFLVGHKYLTIPEFQPLDFE